MEDIKVSLFASAIRARLFKGCLKSLKSTKIPYEVVFCGHNTREEVADALGSSEYDYDDHETFFHKLKFKYIHSGKIKPAQCYEIARRACRGETLSWIADDVEFTENCIDLAYNYWKTLKNYKVALSIQTVEDGYKYNMNDHSFVGFDRSTALMAPVVLLSKRIMDEIGGFDRRFVAGQYENNAIMQVCEAGGSVVIFRHGECHIDHEKKHMNDHKFRAGFTKDRQVLESIWGKRGELLYTGKSLAHEPFIDKDILTKSQSNNLPMWE